MENIFTELNAYDSQDISVRHFKSLYTSIYFKDTVNNNEGVCVSHSCIIRIFILFKLQQFSDNLTPFHLFYISSYL